MFVNTLLLYSGLAITDRSHCNQCISFICVVDVALISAQISCLSVIGELERAWSIFQSSIKNNLIPRQQAVMNLADALFNKDDVSKVLQLVEASNAMKYTVPEENCIKILSEAVSEKKWNDVVWKLLDTYQHSLQPFEENLANLLVTWFERFVYSRE